MVLGGGGLVALNVIAIIFCILTCKKKKAFENKVLQDGEKDKPRQTKKKLDEIELDERSFRERKVSDTDSELSLKQRHAPVINELQTKQSTNQIKRVEPEPTQKVLQRTPIRRSQQSNSRSSSSSSSDTSTSSSSSSSSHSAEDYEDVRL